MGVIITIATVAGIVILNKRSGEIISIIVMVAGIIIIILETATAVEAEALAGIIIIIIDAMMTKEEAGGNIIMNTAGRVTEAAHRKEVSHR